MTLRKISNYVLYILLFCLPFLSILGAILTNILGNNLILLFLMILISVIIFLFTFTKYINQNLYPFSVLMISLALLFHTSFTSRYLIGFDIHTEYYVFRKTYEKSLWSEISIFDKQTASYNSVLSVTIYPTIMSYITGIDNEFIFKILYLIIFSFVPLLIYIICRNKINRIDAFLSSFYLISHSTFYFPEMISLGKQMIAEVFLLLLIYLLFDKKMDQFKKHVLFIIFSISLITSHYTISYILFVYILITWIFNKIKLKRFNILLNSTIILTLFIMIISWSIYIFSSILIKNIWHNLYSIYRSIWRPVEIEHLTLMALGLVPSTFLHNVGRSFFYITNGFIILGFLELVKNRKKFDFEYISLSFTSLALMISCIVLPALGRTLNISRLYNITLLFLTPLCIIGGKKFFFFIFKWRPNLKEYSIVLVSIVLIFFFLFQVGFIYEIAGDISDSIPLSMNRVNKVSLYGTYSQEQDVFSARWLSKNIENRTMIYADIVSRYQVLTSYGLVPRERIYVLSEDMTSTHMVCYVYLSRMNVICGVYFPDYRDMKNTTNFSSILNPIQKIYSNGGSEIYYTFGS